MDKVDVRRILLKENETRIKSKMMKASELNKLCKEKQSFLRRRS